jgi:uncharacterized protein (TIGR02996 family)
MTSNEQMLQKIWKSPGDTQLLAVYADWLATQGEVTRAEYMQLSLLQSPTRVQE